MVTAVRLAAVLALLLTTVPDADAKRRAKRTVSLTIKDADVRDVLTYLAREANLNIVFSDAVRGKVTMSLKRVPIHTAVRVVMRARGLDAIREGNVYIVLTQAEYDRHLEAERAKFRAYPPPPRILP